jgi:hypothetical protein
MLSQRLGFGARLYVQNQVNRNLLFGFESSAMVHPSRLFAIL